MTESNIAPHFVYLFKAHDLFKIGKTVDVVKRMRHLACGLPYGIECVHTIECDASTATIIERALHVAYAQKRVAREWFALSAEDVHKLKTVTNLSEVRQLQRLPISVPGRNFREREAAKRKATRWMNKLAMMPVAERNFLLLTIKSRYFE